MSFFIFIVGFVLVFFGMCGFVGWLIGDCLSLMVGACTTAERRAMEKREREEKGS